MNKQEQIRKALHHLAGKVGPQPTILATVKSVNASELTCSLIDDDGNEIPEVRLTPVIDGNESVTLFPKLNTWALAVRIEHADEWMLIAAGEIDKWRLKIGTTLIEQTAAGLKISKGTADLKTILTNIVEACMQIVVVIGNSPDYAKLTTALTDINTLLR